MGRGLTILPSLMGNPQDDIDLVIGRLRPDDPPGVARVPGRGNGDGWRGKVKAAFFTAAGAGAFGGLVFVAQWTVTKAAIALDAVYVKVPAHEKTLGQHEEWIKAQAIAQAKAPAITEHTAVELKDALLEANTREKKRRR